MDLSNSKQELERSAASIPTGNEADAEESPRSLYTVLEEMLDSILLQLHQYPEDSEPYEDLLSTAILLRKQIVGLQQQ